MWNYSSSLGGLERYVVVILSYETLLDWTFNFGPKLQVCNWSYAIDIDVKYTYLF